MKTERLHKENPSRIIQAKDNRTNVTDNRISAAQQMNLINLIQRSVPGDGSGFKEVPNTGRYTALGGKDIRYNSGTHSRSEFHFGTHTRDDVFARYPHTKSGTRIISIQDPAHNQYVNVEGIQLDHQRSWHNIATTMDTKNAEESPTDFYSFWDAKMYYNDIDNLAPVLGGLNAAAGASGTSVEPPMDRTMAAAFGAFNHTFMDFQAVAGHMDTVPQGQTADFLLKMQENIAAFREKFFK